MELTKEYLTEAYTIDGKSTHTIAKETGVNQTKVRALLIKYGIPLRTKAEAQVNALKSGATLHPTKGKKQPKVVKDKISDSMTQVWKNMAVSERERRSEFGKQQWEEMSEEERKELRKLAGKALRNAAKVGSQLERFLLDQLRLRQMKVDFHSTNVLVRQQLEVDLLLPFQRIAIEIDGPAHFLPIWGMDNLAKHKVSDAAKTGLLIQAGYKVIRVKHLAKNVSEKHKRTLLEKVLPLISHWPDETNKLMEIELT